MNKQIRLARRPEGLPTDENWSLDESPMPEPGDGQVLVKISHVSLDPAMRSWMNEGTTYIEAVEVGDVVGEPVTLACPFAQPETAPVGCQHAPVTLQRIDGELKRGRHVHPAVQHDQFGGVRPSPAAHMMA